MELLCITYFLLGIITTMAQRICEQDINCNLPDCFCKSLSHPMEVNDIPQMVYIGFIDDAFVLDYYNILFGQNRTNPNGCPLTMTLFISGYTTDFSTLKKYYQRGHELALQSRMQEVDKFRRDIEKQKSRIVSRLGIQESEIVGWKSSNLELSGDAQVDVLNEAGFKYDVSMTFSRADMGGMNLWPFTLDYGRSLPCDIPPCIETLHKGFWEIPVNAMMDYANIEGCAMLDTCNNKPQSENQTYKYIMENFLSQYHGNKAPFGIYLKASWLAENGNLNALDRAIESLLEYDNVYIVSMKQMLEWMRTPTHFNKVNSLQSWTCETSSRFFLSIGHMIIILFVLACLALYVRIQ